MQPQKSQQPPDGVAAGFLGFRLANVEVVSEVSSQASFCWPQKGGLEAGADI